MKLKGHTDNVKSLLLNRDGTQVRSTQHRQKHTGIVAVKRMCDLDPPLSASSPVPVGQLWRDHPAVVTRPAAVHRHLPGARRGCLGPAGQRGLHSRLFWRKRQKDLLHWPAEPRHPCAHLWGEGPSAESKKAVTYKWLCWFQIVQLLHCLIEDNSP